MAKPQFQIIANLDAGVQSVFELMSTPAGMRRWVPVCRAVHMEHPAGATALSVGSIRHVVLASGLTAREQILFLQEPLRLDYTILSVGIRMSRLVQDYLGQTRLEPIDETHCRLSWDVSFECVGFMRLFEPLLRVQLRALVRHMVGNICRLTGGRLLTTP